MPTTPDATGIPHRDVSLPRWLRCCLQWVRRRPAAGWRGALLALVGLGLAASGVAQPAAEALEYRVKAAFVCKFIGYVEWPADAFARPDSAIVISVIASDAVVDELTRTAVGLSAGSRPFVVRRLQRGEPVEGSHVVYIAGTHEDALAATLAATKGRPVLIVTESGQAAPPGSVIHFVVVDGKVRFDVAPQAAELRGLRISARLLSVARNLGGKAS